MKYLSLLPGRFAEDQIHGTCHCPSVEPSVSVDREGQPTKLLEVAWLLNGFQKTMKS